MSKRVAFHTLGCRLNFSETGSIADQFVSRGYEVVPFGKEAEVTFLNTCTVTDGADSSCRNFIRKANKVSPEGKLVVAGCYAQMEPEKIRAMTGVDLILGTSEKYKVFDYLEEEDELLVKIDKTSEFFNAQTTSADSHTRAFLKIQDGCNYVCSFCIIPQARGRSRCISVEDAKEQAQKLITDGFKEIVLTGVNIGEYEKTSGEKLSHLVEAISKLPGLRRLRLSSVEPNTITEDLLKVLKASGVYQNHFHIPLQSGSNEILKRMRRKYDLEAYRSKLDLVLKYFPHSSIGADLIAGYPGETQEQFLETYNFVKEGPLTHLHVFPYAKRMNTTAAKEDGHIQKALKKERVHALIALGEEKLLKFGKGLLGQVDEVLFETKNDGHWEGHGSHFIKVRCESDEDLSNQIRTVQLEHQIDSKNLQGQLL